MACQLILKHLQIRYAVACPYNIVRFGVLQHPPNAVETGLAVLTARGAIATCKQAFRLVQLVGNGLRGKPAA